MNITQSFAQLLETELSTNLGQNLFIGGAPLDAPDVCWWVLSAGGVNISKQVAGEKQKNYTISVFYRSLNPEDVYDNLQNLEEMINAGDCKELNDYDIIEMEAILFPTDQDLDNQDRTVGLLQVTITTYFKE
jgi:hypothetical protein